MSGAPRPPSSVAEARHPMHTENARLIHILAGKGRCGTASDALPYGSRCTEARHRVHRARQAMQRSHGIRCTRLTASDAPRREKMPQKTYTNQHLTQATRYS